MRVRRCVLVRALPIHRCEDCFRSYDHQTPRRTLTRSTCNPSSSSSSSSSSSRLSYFLPVDPNVDMMLPCHDAMKRGMQAGRQVGGGQWSWARRTVNVLGVSQFRSSWEPQTACLPIWELAVHIVFGYGLSSKPYPVNKKFGILAESLAHICRSM
jgi:hypothetical protein